MTRDRNEGAPTFVQIIEAEFNFLVEQGFQSVVEDEDSVRYDRRDGVFVRIFRDPRDGYVGFRVGLASRPRDALTATELARLSGVTAPRGEYPDRAEHIRASVARVAQDLQTYGERPLAGDEAIYDEVMELRRAYTEKYSQEGRDQSSD